MQTVLQFRKKKYSYYIFFFFSPFFSFFIFLTAIEEIFEKTTGIIIMHKK